MVNDTSKFTAIIGFGFCGRMVLWHLVKNSAAKKIIIFDRNGEKNLGPAFSQFSPHYILNVPTSKMSAFSDDQKNFCNFLIKNYPQIWQEVGEDGFAPRYIYGKYLEELTNQALEEAQNKNITVEFVTQEVTKITTQNDGFLINDAVESAQILLATSLKQSDLPTNFSAKNTIRNLWQNDVLSFHQENLAIDQKICLIGSGLTAVDVLVGLKKKNHNKKITVISRRGNFPKKHFSANHQKLDFLTSLDAKNGVLFLCLKIRNFLHQNPQYDLRHVVDSLRNITVEMWQNFDLKNKKRFLRLLPYWNIFRHRAPAKSIALIEEMIATKQLEVKKKAAVADDSIYLVNCLGFELNAEKYPLLKQMLASDLLKKDLLFVQSNHPQIHLLGGLNIGRDFECTSVPDLRRDVEKTVNSSFLAV